LEVEYLQATENTKQLITSLFGKTAANHLHLDDDGFSIIAFHNRKPVGFIGIFWKKLIPPLSHITEAYIDIIEVHKEYRRKGIASQLIMEAIRYSKLEEVYQLRAWSSLDKTSAIKMWKALGFGLTPTFEEESKVQGYYVTLPIN
jgi:GNAT superfamily N-acetyltransferase